MAKSRRLSCTGVVMQVGAEAFERVHNGVSAIFASAYGG
jgi:hypothetical protein